MSAVSNPNLNVTRQDLADFYDKIFPYLGGRANAGFTPVGTLIGLMGVTAPANYLACDGTVYNISDYPELATYFGQQFSMINKFGGNGTTTFAVPNLQGQFLRGTGTNSDTTQGSGSAVGERQKSTELPESAVLTDATQIFFRANSANSGYYGGNYKDSTFKRASGTMKNANVATTANTTSATTDTYTIRPTNTSVLWCIATKNIYMNPSLDYSTDEKVVGSDTDGSPIYQKTFFAEKSDFSGQEGRIAHNIANLKSVISFEGIATDSTSNHLQRPLCFSYTSVSDTSAVSWYAGVYVNVTNIVLQMGSAFYNNLQSIRITMRYTKTT